MGYLYRSLVRPALFALDSERAHHAGIRGLKLLSRIPFVPNWMATWNQHRLEGRPVELFGVHFPNRVGLAAGFDKNAEIWPVAGALGFGHVEIGTVTGEPQPGNTKPRLFRQPELQGLVNRMGFNNEGAEAVAERLKHQQGRRGRAIPLGVNIGKSKVTPLDRAVEDYLKSFRLLSPYADYITINVSSPNTPGLRQLQEAEPLRELLGALQLENRSRSEASGTLPIPVLLKISPDLGYAQLDEILSIVEEKGLSGIIATNTSLQRPGALAEIRTDGGLSGRPIFPFSYRVVHYLGRQTKGRLPIVAAGGIHDEKAAGAMLDAGASMVQIYTGMVYEGPFLPARLAWALRVRDQDWV